MRTGFVDGAHYTDWVERVKALMREGRDDDALALVDRLMDAVEAEAKVERWLPAPWYYEQAAKIHRRNRRYSDEVAVLTRYVDVSRTRAFADRIAKANVLLAAERKAEEPAICPACGFTFPTRPARAGECPACDRPYRIRRIGGHPFVVASKPAANS